MAVTVLFWLISGWKRLESAVAKGVMAALRWMFVTRDHAWLALAALLALLAWWQYERATRMANLAQRTQAARQADLQAAEAARAAAETRYRSLAHDADVHYADALAQGDARLAAYLAAHRVQPAAQTPAARPAAGGSAAIPPKPAPEAIVASVNDIRTCDADYAYALAAYQWAAGINPLR